MLGTVKWRPIQVRSAYDALSTGATKAPGRNNYHYVTRAAEPHVFHSLVKLDLAFGVLFAAFGIVAYFFGGTNNEGDDEL